jgi:pyrrolysine biosynthesis protein PylC
MNPKPHAYSFRIGIVGGRLQGIEAAYLAQEAGYQVTVIDRNPEAPALALAHRACVFDIQEEPDRFRNLLSDMDAILPATEEKETLDFLAETCDAAGVTFLHDTAAYAVSSSKIRSNSFFADHGIPVPEKWPHCRFPVIVKPSVSSGSHGLQVVLSRTVLDAVLPELTTRYGEMVVEAYHSGPSLSLEVIARQGAGVGYLVTELEFDAKLDCKRVYAPSRLSPGLNHRFETICLDIARHLKLNGLMDVEVMADPKRGEVVVLEIDARFPSQTPMAVYHASGINLLEEWVKAHGCGQPLRPAVARPGCAWLEHWSVSNSCLEAIGETHLLPWSGLRLWPNGEFFGATVALTNYQEGKSAFKSTLIFTGVDWASVAEKRQRCLERITSALSLKDFIDPTYQMPRLGGNHDAIDHG